MKTISLYKEKLESLISHDEKHFDEFKKEIQNNNNIELIYRGISFDDIFYKLSISEPSYTKYEELSKKLFMIGEKSKCFLQDISEINPEDISNNVFFKIFDILGSKNWSNIDFYIQQEEDFFSFFSNKENKSKFVQIINNENIKAQIFIRNYYLILLHQLSCIDYKEKSLHLSTTIDFDVAKSFTNNNGIVLFSWKIKNKQNINKYRVSSLFNDLPHYNSLPFENEKEYTDFKGLFPHYIYGFQIIRENKNIFVVNHHLFSRFNKNIKKTIQQGIFIDQSNFDKILEETNYKKFFVG